MARRIVRRRIAIAVAIPLIASVIGFGLHHYRVDRIVSGAMPCLFRIDCEKRNAAFNRRMKDIEQDAHEQLRIGTKKGDVARFYSEHKIPFDVVSWPFKDGGSDLSST